MAETLPPSAWRPSADALAWSLLVERAREVAALRPWCDDELTPQQRARLQHRASARRSRGMPVVSPKACGGQKRSLHVVLDDHELEAWGRFAGYFGMTATQLVTEAVRCYYDEAVFRMVEDGADQLPWFSDIEERDHTA